MEGQLPAPAPSWLVEFSASVEQFIRDEAPQTLIEYSITETDWDRLYVAVGKVQPWVAGWREHRAAVAVAAVQAAADAQEGDEA